MNRFKNQILLAAGFAVLAGVIGGITAAPAIAQAIKAALIKNVDERGRVPFVIDLNCFATSSNVCADGETKIPTGKRFVVEHINGHVVRPNGIELLEFAIVGTSSGLFHFSPRVIGTNNGVTGLELNEPFLCYFEGGQTPRLQMGLAATPPTSATAEAHLIGYLVDLGI